MTALAEDAELDVDTDAVLPCEAVIPPQPPCDRKPTHVGRLVHVDDGSTCIGPVLICDAHLRQAELAHRLLTARYPAVACDDHSRRCELRAVPL